jgi:hypothetical protein
MSIINTLCIPSQLHTISTTLQVIITELEQADNYSFCSGIQILPQGLTGQKKEITGSLIGILNSSENKIF